MAHSEVFSDWDPQQRRAAALAIAAERLLSTRLPRGEPGATHDEDASAVSENVTKPRNSGVVVVDVTDRSGTRRSIEVREGDVPAELAQRYAASVPGGITSKQFSKLVHILQDTKVAHFGE